MNEVMVREWNGQDVSGKLKIEWIFNKSYADVKSKTNVSDRSNEKLWGGAQWLAHILSP